MAEGGTGRRPHARPEAAAAAGEAGRFNAVQKLLTAQAGKRITPRPSAEPIRVQRSDDNAAVIVVVGQKVAQDASVEHQVTQIRKGRSV